MHGGSYVTPMRSDSRATRCGGGCGCRGAHPGCCCRCRCRRCWLAAASCTNSGGKRVRRISRFFFLVSFFSPMLMPSPHHPPTRLRRGEHGREMRHRMPTKNPKTFCEKGKFYVHNNQTTQLLRISALVRNNNVCCFPMHRRFAFFS